MITDEEAQEAQKRCNEFMMAHLDEILANNPGDIAMCYAGAMASAVCAWVIKHHGPHAAFDLTQLMADEILEQRLKR